MDWLKRMLPYAAALGIGILLLLELKQNGLMATGSNAPGITAQLDNGTRFDLADHRGKVVVLNFWATWCPPCRAEAPTLSNAYERMRDRGDVMVGLAVDSGDLGPAARAGHELGMRFPIGVPDRAALSEYRVERLPTTYVIAADGTIAWTHVGMVDIDALEEAIAGARR